MNGLNNVSANSISTDLLVVENLQIDVAGTTPLVVPLTTSNSNIANTAFVQGAILTAGANYMDLTTNQTVATGVKTFTNLPESSAVPTTGDQLVNKTFTDANYVDLVNNETIGGIKTFTSLPESSAVPTTGDQLVNKTFTDANYVDLVNNETVGGVKTFTSLPESSAVPTTGDQLVNKTFTDATYVDLVNNETVGGIKTFTSLPESSAVPSTGNQLVNKTYIDGAFITLTTNQSVSGVKTFTNGIVSNSLNATANNSAQTIGSNLTTGSVGIGNAITTGDVTIGNALTSGSILLASGLAGNVNIATNTTASGLISIGNNSNVGNTCQIVAGKNSALSINNDTGSVNLSTTKTNAGTLTICTDATSTRTINIGRANAISIVNSATPTTTLTGSVRINDGGTASSQIGNNSSAPVNLLGEININSSSSSQNTTIGNTTGLLSIIGRLNIIPAGTIIMGLYTTAPTGYVKCDGTSYSTGGIYANLFAVIAYNYGGSGANFNVPDFQGAFLRGTGTQTVGIAYTGGALSSAGRQQDAVLEPLYASNEGFRSCTAGARDCVSRDRITGDPTDTNTGILPRFDRTATENRPFNYSVNYWIRL